MFSENLLTSGGLPILLHGVVLLPDSTSYDSTYSFSTLLSLKFITFTNLKKATFSGILRFMSKFESTNCLFSAF